MVGAKGGARRVDSAPDVGLLVLVGVIAVDLEGLDVLCLVCAVEHSSRWINMRPTLRVRTQLSQEPSESSSARIACVDTALTGAASLALRSVPRKRVDCAEKYRVSAAHHGVVVEGQVVSTVGPDSGGVNSKYSRRSTREAHRARRRGWNVPRRYSESSAESHGSV